MIMYGKIYIVRRELKLRIYESRFRSILTNLYERTDTITSKQTLEIAEMTVLIKMMGKTRIGNVKSRDIRLQCGIYETEE